MFELAELLLDLPTELSALCYATLPDGGGTRSRVFLGTADGALLDYELNTSHGEEAVALRCAWRFPVRAKVDQISRADWGPDSLWVVQDGNVTLHDVHSLKPVHIADGLRGTKLLALDPNRPFLYASVRNRIVVFDAESRRTRKDVAIIGLPNSLSWVDSATLCVGLGDQYALANADTYVVEYFKLPSSLPQSGDVIFSPMGTSGSLAITRQETTLLLSREAAVPETHIRWTCHPRDLTFTVMGCAAAAKDRIEVRSVADGELLQTDAIEGGLALHGTESGFLVLAMRSLYSVRVVSLEEQVQALTSRHSYEEAADLLQRSDMTEQGKDAEIHRIRLLQAHYLFSVQHDYENAMSLFQELHVPVGMVLQLYPQLEDAGLVSDLTNDDRSALAALCRFLTDRRVARLLSSATASADGPGDAGKEAQLVDESLVRIYAVTDLAMAAQLLRTKNSCSSSFVEAFLSPRKMYGAVLDYFYSRGMHRAAMDYLQRMPLGPDERLDFIIGYLGRLYSTNLEIVFEYALEPLVSRPTESLKLFCDRQLNGKSTDRYAIAVFLDGVSAELCTGYLEFLVFVLGDATPAFHDKLAEEYLGASLLSEGSEDGLRLRRFLRESASYNAEALLAMCPEDAYDIRALLLSHLGLHREALSTYLKGGSSWASAEEYCLDMHGKPGAKSIFLDLLDLYMESGNQDRALALLQAYGSYLDPEGVTARLPAKTALAKTSDFWEKSLQEVVMEGRVVQLVGRLSEAELMQVRQEHIDVMKERVSVTGERLCPRCSKKLGSAGFIRTAAGLVHYTCIG